MTASWLIAVLAVAISGTAVWRFEPLPRMPLPSRLSIAFVAGSLYVTTLMFAASAAGIRWSPFWIAPLVILPAFAVRRGERSTADRATWLGIGAFAAITLYGTATARETCADLLYFWGPKAARFAAARGIDVAFLADPEHVLMHSDYPPLVPLLYGWGALVAGGFGAWGPLLLTAFLLAAAAAVVHGFASLRTGAAGAPILLAAVLAFTFAEGLAAGAAEPLLILFEVTAISALTFAAETPGGAAVASIALAAAAMTKVEGAAFVAIAIVAWMLVSRRLVRALAIALPAGLLLAAWIPFAAAHGLLDSYSRATAAQAAAPLGTVLRALVTTASYHALYLPWIALFAALAASLRHLSHAKLPLLAAAGSLAAILYFYLHPYSHGADAVTWIVWSAERVLITPLALLAVAVAAAEAPEKRDR